MDRLQFTKMSGAGNDFIVIDNRDGKVPERGREDLFRVWCRRRLDIGADGVLLVEPPQGADADFRMRYHNADGAEAESCGNGARCIARFAHLIGAAPEAMSFETEVGLYRATVVREDVILTMSDPHSLRRHIELDLPDLAGEEVDFMNTGVPHAVTFVSDLSAAPLESLAPKIRYHAVFAPDGTNVNFAQVLGENRIAMRTYERGVEAETLACGTGAVAVALIARLRGLTSPPVSIQTSGGPVLKIHFDQPGASDAESSTSEAFSNVRLEGEARIVYEGTIGGTLNAAMSRS